MSLAYEKRVRTVYTRDDPHLHVWLMCGTHTKVHRTTTLGTRRGRTLAHNSHIERGEEMKHLITGKQD